MLEAELAAVKRASELFCEDRVMRPKELFPIVEALGAEGHGLKASCRLLGVSRRGSSVGAPGRCLSGLCAGRGWPTPSQRYGCGPGEPTGGGGSRPSWPRSTATPPYTDHLTPPRASRNLVLSVMGEQGISGLPRRKGRRRDLLRAQTASDLVNREFGRDGPNQLWMTDITEHPTREGKLYVRAVLDARSRKVVGWSIDRRATAAMVNSALAMAIESRKPDPGAVVHSDHGSQYTSWAFSQRLRKENLNQSLGTAGDAFDNAVVEAFWARMQTELLDTKKWKTRTELSTAIFDWIEIFYNRTRRHSSLGNISPAEFERRHHQQPNAA